MVSCDVLIVGSGVAGLSLAIKLNKQFPHRKIVIVTKGDGLESNTRYAQGGISAVFNKEDSIQKHIEDTLCAGDGLCDKKIVEKVVRYGRQAIGDLTSNGVDFDHSPNGEFALRLEGGHSFARIVHKKDMTGFEIAMSLLAKCIASPGVTLLTEHSVIDLISENREQSVHLSSCCGAVVLDEKNNIVKEVMSKITVLATGGIGQVFNVTTNPTIATGDGIGIAHRAGALVDNMEFVQFHPTAFCLGNDDSQCFLISETLRGFGAILRNRFGDRFMQKYHTLGELACRDVVARAIACEIGASGHPAVFLDCTHLGKYNLKKEFPKIYTYCLAKGIDISKDFIPVVVAAHYSCGGIKVDENGRTSISRLYALGECANTGLHGANRLASNSLLEAVAFSEFCFRDIEKRIDCIPGSDAPGQSMIYKTDCQNSNGPAVLRKKVQNLMSRYAGVVRSTEGLQYALGYLELVEKRLRKFYPNAVSRELLELRNILITSKLIVIQSLNQKANKGTFYNTDLDLSRTIYRYNQKIYF